MFSEIWHVVRGPVAQVRLVGEVSSLREALAMCRGLPPGRYEWWSREGAPLGVITVHPNGVMEHCDPEIDPVWRDEAAEDHLAAVA
jgi:hypothetical protein